MNKVAIIGTVGVPAKYGGFETLVENIIEDSNKRNIEYTVYCSSKSYSDKIKEYKGAKLKYVPLKANGLQSILYDIISLIDAINKHDAILLLGVSGAFALPLIRLFSRKKVIVNIDGLEHRRDKWGKFAKKLLKLLEKIAVKYATVVVADNKAIQDYVRDEYGKESVVIAYGGDHALCKTDDIAQSILEQYGLEVRKYSFSLCRIEPENNVHIALEAFCNSNSIVVFVGNWNNSPYGMELRERYKHYSNLLLFEPIYDIAILNVLRANAKFYIHGHSAGGTNPSLVEIMFFGCPIFCFDVNYNRETTEGRASYYKNVEELKCLIGRPFSDFAGNGKSMQKIARRRYLWRIVRGQYEELIFTILSQKSLAVK